MFCDILIIDDDQDDVEILSDAFRKSGVGCVHYVHTAMQAFIYLQQVTFHEDLPKLLVTDHYLPGITGTQFLADLKAMPIYKHIPVIVLSSIKNEQEIERYKQLGIHEYLVKPNSFDEYVEVAKQMKEKFLKK
jgi:CheY-like chemotaxis protein